MGKAIINGNFIEGVIVQDLKQIKDDRGSVMHMLRSDSPFFEKFGEIYFSAVNKDVVKAWKRHKIMKQHFAIPLGSIKLVIYDNREKSTTYDQIMEISVGENNFALVKIPPMVWYGFKGESNDYSLIVNCTTIPFDENEVERISEKSSLIPFNW
jgi:dTDP-4-dehydrorhamnose 3,5-epimerase